MNSLYRLLILITILGLLLPGCKNQPENKTSSIRFANFVVPTQEIKMVVKGPDTKEFNIKYGTLTSFTDFREGKYTFSVQTTNDSLILEKELGIGHGSKYTITISGIFNHAVKKRKTLHTQLMEAFKGATAFSANAGMPVMQLYLDRFEGSPSEGKLKAILMAPAISDVELYVKTKGKFEKITTLVYPKPSSREYSLKPGSHSIQLRFKNSEEILYSGQLNLPPGKLTTLYVFGKNTAYPYTLQTVVVTN